MRTHDNNIYYVNDQGTDVQIQSFSYDAWYKIKIVADLVTDKCSIHVYNNGGSLLRTVTGALFRYMPGCNDNISSICFNNGWGYNGTLYINDLKITN